jgi:hypothetical protein
MPRCSPWKQPPSALSLALILLLTVNYFSPFGDLDYTWQVRTGGVILNTGQLRPVETFSYTINGQRPPDFEWLYEVILWTVWNSLGYGGLKLVKLLLVTTPPVLLCWRLQREGVHRYGRALALLTAIPVLALAWNLRPLYGTTIGLLLVWGWLHDHCVGRRPSSVFLPVAMLFWSNLHPGVIVGQALLVGAILWEWLNRWIRLNPSLDQAACWRLTGIGGLGLAATFVSPDPLERLAYPFRPELAHPIMRVFGEMQPLHTFALVPPYATNLVYLVAGLVLVTLVLRFRQYRLWEVALLAGLALLGSIAVRSVQDWLLVMLALGVPHAKELLRCLGARLREARRANRAAGTISHAVCLRLGLAVWRVDRFCKLAFRSPLLRWQWFWPIVAASVFALISLIPPLARRMPIQNASEWPVAAVDWIETQGLGGRFFSPPDYGAYLIWRLGERAQSYVDTRGFFFPPELLEDSHFVPQLYANWEARLERILAQGTDYFLLETTGARGQLWQALAPHIGTPLYRDEHTVLLSTAQVQRGVAQFGRRKFQGAVVGS